MGGRTWRKASSRTVVLLVLLVSALGLLAVVVIATDGGSGEPAETVGRADGGDGGGVIDTAQDPASASPSIRDSGVLVTARGCRVESFGAGVVVSEGVVTNAHVVAGTTSVDVITPGGGAPVAAEVVAFDPLHDVALLRPSTPVGEPLPFGQPVPGSTVTALARGMGETEAAVLIEIDVAVERVIDIRISDIYGDGSYERDGLELSGDLGPGDSGAGLVDATGALVGIVFSSSRGKDGVAYAVSSSEVIELMANIPDDPVDTGKCRP